MSNHAPGNDTDARTWERHLVGRIRDELTVLVAESQRLQTHAHQAPTIIPAVGQSAARIRAAAEYLLQILDLRVQIDELDADMDLRTPATIRITQQGNERGDHFPENLDEAAFAYNGNLFTHDTGENEEPADG